MLMRSSSQRSDQLNVVLYAVHTASSEITSIHSLFNLVVTQCYKNETYAWSNNNLGETRIIATSPQILIDFKYESGQILEVLSTCLDGAEVSTSGWGSGGPRFQSISSTRRRMAIHYRSLANTECNNATFTSAIFRAKMGFSPTQNPNLTFQSCSRYQLINWGVKPHQNRPSKSRIFAGYQILDFHHHHHLLF